MTDDRDEIAVAVMEAAVSACVAVAEHYRDAVAIRADGPLRRELEQGHHAAMDCAHAVSALVLPHAKRSVLP